MDFPSDASGKEPACKAGDVGSIRGSGRSSGGGSGNLLQYSWLENPMDRGAWQAMVHRVTRSQTRLSDWAQTSGYRSDSYCSCYKATFVICSSLSTGHSHLPRLSSLKHPTIQLHWTAAATQFHDQGHCSSSSVSGLVQHHLLLDLPWVSCPPTTPSTFPKAGCVLWHWSDPRTFQSLPLDCKSVRPGTVPARLPCPIYVWSRQGPLWSSLFLNLLWEVMDTIPSSSHILFCELSLQGMLEDFGRGVQGSHRACGSDGSFEWQRQKWECWVARLLPL